MSKIDKVAGWDAYTIASDDQSTQAQFLPDRGAMGCSLIMPGSNGPRELLFLHDYFNDPNEKRFTGGWPFCFPVCGRLKRYGQEGYYYYDGQVYQLDIHGFASQLPWEVVDFGEQHLHMRLSATAATLAQYPFEFEIELAYHISRGLLECRQTYKNKGARPMPYYAGFHPYFATPGLKQGKANVVFNCEPVKSLAYNETLTDLIGGCETFPLPTSITADINERLLVLGQNKTTQLTYPDGDILKMTVTGVEDPNLFPYLQIYTPLKQPFICIEPWMGHPNALNSVEGVRWLAPGASEHGDLSLELRVGSFVG
ncbi:MAG: aldose epimerase [Gammaproteobacteria bacterium]